jgi:DnaJ domain
METLLRQGRALNLYGLLNLESTATNEEIREAYKALSRVFHPDRLRAQDAAEAEPAKDFFVSIKAVCELFRLRLTRAVWYPRCIRWDIRAFRSILCLTNGSWSFLMYNPDEVLSDPVYRFAYDTYDHEGIRYFMLCRQLENGPQFNQQQNALSLNLSLYGEIQSLLQNDPNDRQTRLAHVLLKSAIERYRQQLKMIQRRLRESIVSFDARLDLPCAFHPQAAAVVEEPSMGLLPYLELEAVRLEFSVRTSNQEQFIQNSSQQTKPETKRQLHLMSAALGAKTDWAATGKGDVEAFLEGTYKNTATSKTIWDYEVRRPLTATASSKKPISVRISSTREFLGGTVAAIGLQGNNVTRDSWAYRFSSRRRLRLGVGSETDSASALQPNIMASFAGAFDFFSCRPMLGVVTLTTIENQQHNQSRQHDKNQEKSATTDSFWSPLSWSCSTPVLSIRAGYHPTPIHASIKYVEFGKPWASLDAAWSWNMAEEFSKIKVVLSADLWGFYEDNDTTTIRTGIKHDLLSGWIWLWEWEERDWTLKVPISLSHSKNAQWLGVAMGMETLPSDKWHVSLGSILAWFLAVQVAQTLLGDWVSNDNPLRQERSRHSHSRDATFSEGDRRLEKQDFECGKGDAFRQLMVKVAHKKRAVELSAASGLVIRSAKLVARKDTAVASSAFDTQNDEDLASAIAPSVSPAMEAHPDLTDTLQFWVREGRLALPPLSSRSSTTTGTNFYSIGGMSDDNSISASSDMSVWTWFNQLSQVCMEQLGVLRKWLVSKHLCIEPQGDHVNEDTLTYDMVIRYQHQGNAYDKTFTFDEDIVLPSSKAWLLGPAATVT